MSSTTKTTFRIGSWDEKPVQEFDEGEKIVAARVTQIYSGELEGNGSVEYLMYYQDPESASFIGYETFEGQFNGRAGRFVMVHNGRYADGVASSEWRVVPDSASGELSGLSGSGSFGAGEGGEAAVTLKIKHP